MSTIKADNYEATTAGNNLIFKANGTEKMRISPNVGGVTNITGVGVGLGGSAINLNSNGTTVHIHENTAGGSSILHCTNAAQGLGAAKGFICGLWGPDSNKAYVFTYDPVDMLFGTSANIRMTITSAGNVGIGTASPAAKLDVNGTAKCTALTLGSSTLSTPSGSAPIYGARAWIVFNGFNMTVLNSANCTVARTTGIAAGVYTITFTTAMPSANYVIVASCSSYAQANQTVGPPQIYPSNTGNPTAADTRYAKSASSFTIVVSNGSTKYDLPEIYVAVFA